MGAMTKVMVTIATDGPAPSLDEVRERYGLAGGDLDERFGVVDIAPGQGLYTVLVEQDAAGRITDAATPGSRSTDGEATDGEATTDGDWDASGPYSDPRIEPFGPPEP